MQHEVDVWGGRGQTLATTADLLLYREDPLVLQRLPNVAQPLRPKRRHSALALHILKEMIGRCECFRNDG